MQKTCAWLRKEGIDLADTNNQGHNALHKAAYGGHTDLCLWLQDEVRLDPEALIKDARGQDAVALARKAGFEDLAVLLLRRRTDASNSGLHPAGSR